MAKKAKKKVKMFKCDGCGKLTENKDKLCDECLENDSESPQDWEFDAYGEECWGD